MSKERTCLHCKKKYTAGTSKNACYSCYGLIKKYGTATPEHHNRKCECCDTVYASKYWKQKFCSKVCYKKTHVHNRFVEYRKENGIDLSIPKKYKAPNGMGHRDPHGYVYINRISHPNAQKEEGYTNIRMS